MIVNWNGLYRIQHEVNPRECVLSCYIQGHTSRGRRGDSDDRVTYGRMEFGRNFGRDRFEWWLPVPVPCRHTISEWQLERSPELIGLEIDCQV
jgi:hypothetical protein